MPFTVLIYRNHRVRSMRRISKNNKSKRAITLVELIVAMTLTMIFAGCCVLLIAPISKIYTHQRDLSRAQLVADTVIDSLRSECSRTLVQAPGDVWITNSDAGLPMSDVSLAPNGGSVLVVKKNIVYCETIASNYEITRDVHLQGVDDRITDAFPDLTPVTTGDARSRSIYWLFDESAGSGTLHETDRGYVHFGYYESGATTINTTTYILPQYYYDFTNPFASATYGRYVVSLNFHDLTNDSSGVPAYVLCDVSVQLPVGTAEEPQYDTIYTRTAVLCFS